MKRLASLFLIFTAFTVSNSCSADKSESARLQKALETIYREPIDKSLVLIIPMLGCRFSLEETIEFCQRNAEYIEGNKLEVIFTETPDTKTLNFMLGEELKEVCAVDTTSIFRDFDFYFSGYPIIARCENGKVISIESIVPDKLTEVLEDLESEFI
jgi:hypothetical protein